MLFVIIHHILGSEKLEQPWLKCIHLLTFCPPRREYTCENDFEKLEVSKSAKRVLFTSYNSVKSDFQVNTSAP